MILLLMKVLSVDLGATSGRVMMVEHLNHIFSYQEILRFENRTYLDDNGYLRWDFNLLLNNIILGIRQGLRLYDDIESISIDSWAVDYGLLQDDKLINDPICYRDIHSFESQKELLSKVSFKDIYSKYGIQNLHFNTLYQLLADKQNLDNADSLLLIPDLIAFFLTGSKRIEETNLSTTSFYLYNKKKIDEEFLKQLNIPTKLFPNIIYPGDIYGYLKDEYSQSKKIPVIACSSHDTASAVLGSNGKNDFAYISSGTWSLIGTELKKQNLSVDAYKYNFTNEVGYNNTIRFLKNTMGMFLINEVRKDFSSQGINIPNKDIVSLVNDAKDIETYIDVNNPIFETPNNMLSKVKEYITSTNQILPSTCGEMLRLIYKSMALAYKEIIHKLETLNNKKIKSILVVGGGNQAEILNQYTASACKIEVKTGSSEATVLGNSLVQFIALKEIASVEEGREDISSSIESKIYKPKDESYWDKEYENYISFINRRMM